ncbi:MAG: phosphotransferase family protein [Desulfobacterales bacterium]|jgi:aminoglycoside phosphotransferase (APT) family kinase protein|nr:phosphotransferase family protein [Desulfobacterales bacterium]
MIKVDKNNPSKEFIETIRRRFPIESEIDRILTSKMNRRPGKMFSPLTLESLSKNLEQFIRSKYDQPFKISDVDWLPGGASKLQVGFILEWGPPGDKVHTPMVLRMEPEESICESSRSREFQIIKAFEGTVPVPPVYWVDEQKDYMPLPALIYGFVEGVTKPKNAVRNVTGVGLNVGTRLRKILTPQFIGHLSIIHTCDFKEFELKNFDCPRVGTTEAALWAVNWWERVWEEDAGEDVPLLRYTAAWLRDNLPITDRLSIVHGDFRTGNWLFREEDGKITAWLDWELAHIGDRHEDLGWAMLSAFGHMDEDGKKFLVGGLLPEKEFIDAYEKASGTKVNPKTLYFYRIQALYKSIVITLGTGYRIAKMGKTHQDVLVAWLMGVAPVLLADLSELLEKGE